MKHAQDEKHWCAFEDMPYFDHVRGARAVSGHAQPPCTAASSPFCFLICAKLASFSSHSSSSKHVAEYGLLCLWKYPCGSPFSSDTLLRILHLLSPWISLFFFNFYFIYLLIWLCRVLVEACRIFVSACGIFCCGAWALCSVRAL